MLLQQARAVHRKKWAAKHEHEELKAGNWLELVLALLRKKTKEEWTEKHRNAARLLCFGRRMGAEEAPCNKEEGTERHRLFHCPVWHELRRGIAEALRKCEQKVRTSKKEWR